MSGDADGLHHPGDGFFLLDLIKPVIFQQHQVVYQVEVYGKRDALLKFKNVHPLFVHSPYNSGLNPIMNLSFIRNVGARRLALGPMACFRIIALLSVLGFQILTFFPFAVVMVPAV